MVNAVHGTRSGSGQDVAVVGMACRLPGADSPEAFWRLLAGGTSAVSPAPADRLAADVDAPHHGGFLADVAGFDPAFFGISPREAAMMDPQQRLVLELAWEALEDARTVPATLAGTRTGVFVGAMADDYAALLHRRGLDAITQHTLTGLHRGAIANRVSYLLDAHGPSLTVDSGQSSSLVAVHLACESLRSGESIIAVAGGVNLILAPESTVGADRFGGLSPDGRCFTFDARANGYARGEGGGLVVLKPLAAALADGDRIHCVIRGGAVNNDGTGENFTAPNPLAQQEVLREAYRDAGVDPGLVGYVELHGTGTRLGDPVEAAALGAVVGTAPGRTAPLVVGSAKTNVGHLEGAAGVVGLLKLVLAIRHRGLPASLNFEHPNPDIPLAALNLVVPTEFAEWPDDDGPLLAGVSSFGMGGTNCHLVLSSPPESPPAPVVAEDRAVPVVLSGVGAEAVRAQAARLRSFVDGNPDLALPDLGRSAATTRTAFRHRAGVVARDRGGLLRALDGLASGVTPVRSSDGGGGVAFLFSGQGAQRTGMGRELCARFPVFADVVAAVGVPLDEVDARRTEWAQPALFAFEVGMFRLLESWGVRPDYLVGHSVGELAAAHVAGVLSLRDAVALVSARARLMQALPGGGAMVSLRVAEAEVRPLLVEGVSIAAVNGPEATVVSGDEEPVLALAAHFASLGRRTKRLPVSHAFHSHRVDGMLAEFGAVAEGLTYHEPRVPIVSNVTGGRATDLTSPEYWVRHVREAVRFADGLAWLGDRGVTTFVELGPDAALTALGRDCLPDAAFVASQRKDVPEETALAEAVAELHTCGVEVDWEAVFAGARVVDLPTYAFQRQDHWFDRTAGPAPEPVRGLDDLLAVVRAHAAAVLGHPSGDDVAADLTFKGLGLDSIGSVELCRRLDDATGLRLPSTLLYDHPTPADLARHLESLASGDRDAVEVVTRAAPDEPIAIVAMACRYPGGIGSPEDLWRLLAEGGDAITGLPVDRGWRLDSLYDPDPTRNGKSYTREGGFLHDAAEFDAAFFGISPREALGMDPQQRLLLETSWEVLERAGIDPVSLRGSRSGVFIGATHLDYGPRLHEAAPGQDGFALTGSTTSVASGRIAYTFGFEGPAITVDTACSSSLVALHLACQALRQGEATLAIAGGATVMSGPGMLVDASRLRGVSVDARCKSFAAAADGTGLAEGVGVLLVERLSDARRHGHSVLAVVRGSAVNSDGASNGLAAPNGRAQERVVRLALANARLSTSDVDVVEAHGTGTKLGDPIEANALIATYGRDRDRPLWLGSVKSNIGHTQAAAGVAGVMKLVLALRHGELPRTLHVDAPSPHVDWAAGAVELATEPRPWPRDPERPRRGGVSSFGISGTNAHVVLEEPDDQDEQPVATAPQVLPWMLSAKTSDALAAQTARLAEFVTASPESDLADIASSLAGTRARLQHRAVVVAADRDGFLAGLAASPVTGVARDTGKVAFVFPGQGSQWVGMARDLLAQSPVFAARMAECAAALAPHVDWSLFDALGDAAALERSDVVQPVLFAVMVSLAEVWRSLGVVPAAVVGQSQGEIAAACVAGALSLPDAARVVALRSKVVLVLSGRGGLVSVPLPVDEVRGLLGEGLSVAAVNGPSSIVVSGDLAGLEVLLATVEGAKRVQGDYASHSAHVEEVRDDLLAALVGITPRTPEIPFVSTVTGEPVEVADAEYWYSNLRRTVLLEPVIRDLAEHGFGTFVEVSTHPVLRMPLTQTVGDAVVSGTLRRDEGGLARFLTSAAELWVRGVDVDLLGGFTGRRVDLPTYAFQRKRFWLDVHSEALGNDLAYRLAWQPVDVPAATALPGRWVVVAPLSLADGDFVRALVGLGAEVVVDGQVEGPADGVLSLLAFGPDALHRTAALVRDPGTDAPLWVATSGDVDQAALWGLGRVAALEHPDRWGGLVELPDVLDGRAARRLTGVLAGTGEDQISLRGNGVQARRLVRTRLTPARPWRPAGTVLVTGATGVLGPKVATWLARNGAEHLLLVSRRGPDAPGAEALRADLTALGTAVTIEACDVADRDALAALLARHPVSAVVHAAGVLDDGVIGSQTPQRIDAVLRAKATAAVNLHELTSDLSAFVLFSSVVGTLGRAGQATFAAANAVLDALARHRHDQGLAATSIAWGPWQGDDMVGEELRRGGLSPMSAESALSSLREAVDSGEPAVVVASVDWERFAPAFTAVRPSPLLADLVGVGETETVSPLVQRLASLTAAEQDRALLDLVCAQVAVVLGHSSGAEVETGRAFREVGFDSLTAVELRNRLNAVTGLKLATTVVFNHTNPIALAGHLRAELLGAVPAAPDLPTAVDPAADPIAIVAMACRYPGGVRTPDELWRLVAAGTDAISALPTDRGWDVEGIYDPDQTRPGTTSTREGGFLHDAAEFDPAFFGISPREAVSMDPQQRLLLETSWEVFERAGIDPASLRGSRAGVFTGVASQDVYGPRMDAAPQEHEGYLLTGSAASILSGRVSYTFGLEGPAITVDTACSSSLVALHLAAQALRQGECTLALAGGVTVMATPGTFIEFSRQGGLAPDGRCKAFSSSADGTSWSEGVGVLLLERLSDARRLGHPVLALVRGSAVNQDGASNGLTAPNGPAQERVIRQALASAGLSTSDVDAVEAHGTGTTLGDPIEAQALLATYGQDRDRQLWLGSLKSNIGHAQAAAGVGGVIKMVQAMRHGVLPRTLHVDEPSPHVDWSKGSVELLTESRPWDGNGRPRRVGVSSFGVSGTNAHVIIEHVATPVVVPTGPSGAVPWVLSAKTPEALRDLASRLAEVDARPADVGYTLAVGRSHLEFRAAVVGEDRDDLVAKLRDVVISRVGSGKVAFLFSGQGSQRLGMGRELYGRFPVFAEAFDAVGLAVTGDLDETGVAQPALFALEVALFRLLESWGVCPDFVMGHSVGELAAAHVAGVLSLADAVVLVSARARLMQALPAGGAMVSLEATEAEVLPLVGPDVSIAAVNGPLATVVSGEQDAVLDIAAYFYSLGRRTKRLAVSHAFHSHRMDGMLAEFAAVAEGLAYDEPRIPVVSNVTGGLADVASPGYWVRHVREAVRFADGLACLAAEGVTRFVELGPDGVLSGLVDGGFAVPLLRRDRAEDVAVMEALGRLHVEGVDVDWEAVFTGAAKVELPTYAFQRQRYWVGTPTRQAVDQRFWEILDQADADAPLSTVLPALSSWRHRDPDQDWCYRVDWRPIPDGPSTLSGRWLVLHLDDEVVRALTRHGADVVSDPDAGPFAGVLALPGHDVTEVLALVHAGIAAPLWVVTRAAVPVGETVHDPLRAALWGLGRAVALEHPDRWGGLVDLPAVADERALDRLCAVLAGLGGEDQVAIRDSGVHARRLVRALPTAKPADGWTPAGTVLVTGGTGALGARVAKWLARGGADHLVLVSRRGPDAPGAADLVADLEAMDVRVTVAACDVADRAALADLLVVHPPDAVVHTAGVVDDGMLDSLTPERFEAVFGPKATAALNLHELAGDLAAFVLFSSAAGVLGNAGQGNYSAANAVLDALADHRRASGLPATSIAWGAWAEDGMATGGAAAQRIHRTGFGTMKPDRALAALGAALRRDETAVMIADVDWEKFGPGFTAARPSPLLADLLPPARAASGLDLGGLSEVERDRRLLDLVRVSVAAVLGHSSATAIRTDGAFKDLGFDSLTAVELRNRLAATTGLTLSSTLVFDHPTPVALAGLLRAELFGGQDDVADRPDAAAAVDEPIAIVAMSCRFPGGVESPEDLWRLLVDDGDAITEFPTDRGWDLAALYHPDPDHSGTSYVRHGGFLRGAAGFDAGFFGISPREALAMDPQQRVLLETSWEALERAGIDPLSLRGSKTGVFVGSNGQDYAALLRQVPDTVEGYLGVGIAGSVVSGRVAYSLGVEGPAITVDTACSSSLVALHLAAQSLRQGECPLALVAGVTVMATPEGFVEFSRQRGLAPDGRCKPFAAGADGTGWSEGVGVLLVERLSDARRLGHPVLAVVRGSAVNQDGASNGLTAPNGPSQQRVIRQALANAGLSASDVDVVEAHGTGTRLGDPIEAQALLATYGQGRDRPLWLGSVKSNLGHTQAAAGVAGVIKVVLAMRHGVLPRTLHVDEPSPHVDWSAGAVELLTEARPWDGVRRAGVSSFGVSGTNAHVVLEHVSAPDERSTGAAGDVPWVLSGKTADALRDQASRLAAFVRSGPDVGLGDVAFSLAATRAAFEHRAVVVAADRDGFLAGLAEPPVSGVAGDTGKVVFVFPGQGSQWVGMACELLGQSEVFAGRMGECAEVLSRYVDWSLFEVLGDEVALARVDVVQPVLFAVMVSLAEVWRSFGVVPDAVVGHSQGEIAAACVSGALSLDDAARVVALRSKAILVLSGRGGMVSVPLPVDEVRGLIGGGVSIAAVNGPSSVVVSGSPAGLAEVLARVERAKRIPVDYASHSVQVEEIHDELLVVLDGIVPCEPEVEFVSTVTGAPVGRLDAEYWYRNLRQTVLLEPVVRGLVERGFGTFVEMSPHPVLTVAVGETAEDAVVVGTLRRGEGGLARFLTSAAELWVRGVRVDLMTGVTGRRVDLPTYPFQRERFWPLVGPRPGDMAAVGMTAADHPLLGAAVPLAGADGFLLTGRLSLDTHPWLADHAVGGTVLLPGTAFVELALRAGDQVGCARIEELTIEAPLVVPPTGGVQVQLVVGAAGESGSRPVELHSRRDEEPWTRHATGLLAGTAAAPDFDLRQWPPAGAAVLGLDDLHDRLADRGVHYGEAFQGVEAAWSRDGELYVQVRSPGEDAGLFGLHPALLDAALQPLALGTLLTPDRRPFAWNGVSLHATGATALRVRITATGEDSVAVRVADSSGRPVASVAELVLRPAPNPVCHDSLHRVDWTPVAAVDEVVPVTAAVIGDDGFGLASALGIPSYQDISAFDDAPELVFAAQVGPDTGDVAADVRAATHRTLDLLQRWLADDRFTAARLVLVTGPVTDLVTAPVWGLVRSAQVENPDRFVLLELDGASTAVVPSAIATREPQLALRAGVVFAPRLVRHDGGPTSFDGFGRGTVLVTGAGGGLTEPLVRHLVADHEVKRLVLVSRRGAAADGMAALCEDLGVDVRLEACDVSDRAALGLLLADIPDLTAVVHTAAVLDDGTIPSLTPERIDRVLAPKVDGVLNLHDLTADRNLSAFVLFSSLSGTLGGAGLGNYSAANAFLDAFAQHRHALGLPAVSLAWGLWEQRGGMVGRLDDVDLTRMSRLGGVLMSTEEGLALFDVAVADGRPLLAPAKLDLAALRAQAGTGELAALFRGLVRTTGRRAAVSTSDIGSLADRLAALSPDERAHTLLELVRGRVAAVLGHTSPDAVAPGRPFKELGFDSLTSVELRNRLNAATGLRLPATLVFDHPTPDAVARRLGAELVPEAVPVFEELDRLEARLTALAADDEARGGVTARLRALLWKWDATGGDDDGSDDEHEPVTDDEMFDLIDKELGSI